MAGDTGGYGDEAGGDTDGAPTGGTGGGLSLDTVFELLADRRRRVTMYCLREMAGSVVECDGLVEAVADRETALGIGAGDAAHRCRVERDLDTWHLAVLEEVGVAEYDQRSGSVRYHGDETLDRWLAKARDAEINRDDLE